MQENTDQKTPNTDTFQAVIIELLLFHVIWKDLIFFQLIYWTNILKVNPILTHMPLTSFIFILKYQKTRVFLMFSERYGKRHVTWNGLK